MSLEPRRDEQTVTPEGESVQRLPEGVTFRDAVTHIDARGTITELFDQWWGWHEDPLVFTYAFTIRPGMIKGWGMHKDHEDRYFVLFGEMEMIFYDSRPDSPTCGEVSSVVLSEYRRRLIEAHKRRGASLRASVGAQQQRIGELRSKLSEERRRGRNLRGQIHAVQSSRTPGSSE